MATMEESSQQHAPSGETLDRPAQLQAEIQQCQIEMVYSSLLERRRLQRQIMRAEAEISRMAQPDTRLPARGGLQSAWRGPR